MIRIYRKIYIKIFTVIAQLPEVIILFTKPFFPDGYSVITIFSL